jgi:endoglucanase
MDSDFADILRSILTQPTAPFHEDAVRGEIAQLLSATPAVRVTLDPAGNLVATLPGVAPAETLCFAAHMDHPAYVGDSFLGGVPERYRAKNPPTRSYGPFSMWDLPAYQPHPADDRLYARACDDLVGCAVIVATLRALALRESPPPRTVVGLFTRAEEVGFVGALAWLRHTDLQKAGTTILSLETSSVTGGPARMGEGPIIRVGDRTSLFDRRVTLWLESTAKAADLPHQRLLMSGGTCEATAYQLFGYTCGALCVALGNYHNCAPDNDEIVPEYVSLRDVAGLRKLCIALATTACNDPVEEAERTLREKLLARAAAHASTLYPPPSL